jgi:hypothetical protein
MACIKLKFISTKGYFTYSVVNFFKLFKNDKDETPDVISLTLLPACIAIYAMKSDVNL